MSKHLYSELRAAWNKGSASRFNDIVADHIDALDPRYKIEVGRTAFWFASAVGAVDAMRLLWKRGADVNSPCELTGLTPLHAAVRWGSIEALKQLTGDMRATVNARDKYGQTALMIAALDGNDTKVENLLDHRASVDAIDDERRTALMLAVNRNRLAVVDMLIHKGKANLQLQDKDGRTAIDFAKSAKVRDALAPSKN
jgi:ankyrin repeat protein